MDYINKTLNNMVRLTGTQSESMTLLFKIFIIIVSAAIALVLLWLIFSIIEKLVARNRDQKIIHEFFRYIKGGITLIILLLAGIYIVHIFHLAFVAKIIYALFALSVAGPVFGLLKIILGFLETHLADRTKTDIDDIVIDLLDKFAGFLVYTTAIIIALDILGVNVMPFVAGAGVAGIAIGFAAKDTLSNLIAGFLLLIDRPFEVGDRIEVWSAPAGSATWGDVIDIGLRATRIKTTDNIHIIIPNNVIMTRDIVNYTQQSDSIRVRVNIGVGYGTDTKKAKEIILQVADTIEWVQDKPAPKVVVRNFGESSVDLQLRLWINNARMRMDTISEITDKVKDAFEKEGIEIPFPKRDITIVQKETAPK